MAADFPTDAAAVTADWLTRQLRAAGMSPDARVIGADHRSVGTGQVGDTVRFTLAYDPPGAGPPTLAAKFAAADPASRSTAVALGLYRQEVTFYRDLAARIAVRTPRAYAAEISEDGADCVLLLEDLGPCRAGNQLDGCTLAEARDGVRQLAALHAATIGDPLVEPWTARAVANDAAVVPLYAQAHAVFRDRYRSVLDPAAMAVCDAVAERFEAFARRPRSLRSVVHGDFRLDNLLFSVRGGAEAIAVVDWQTAGADSPLRDLAYFLGTGIGSALRRPNEEALIALWLGEMERRGVRLTRADVDRDYRLGALYGIVVPVFSAAFVARTDRGDANFLSMVRGAAEQALDHDGIGALDAAAEATTC